MNFYYLYANSTLRNLKPTIMKKMIALFALCATVLVANAQLNYADFKDNGIYYKILSSDNGGNSVAVCSDQMLTNQFEYGGYVNRRVENLTPFYSGDVVVPSTVKYNGENYTVTTVERYAFTNCTDLNSVKLPETISIIHDYAFYGCGVVNVNIPKAVKYIGDCAFRNSLNVGDFDFSNVETINNWGLCGFDGRSLKFSGKLKDLYSFILEDTQVKEIEFEDNPDGELHFASHCFAYSQLENLVLPKTPLRLALEFMHENPYLERVVFNDVDKIAFAGSFQTVIAVECCYTETHNLINKCPNLKEIVSLCSTPPVIHNSGQPLGPYFVHITDNLETTVLRVPKGSEDLYRADAVWGEFKNIQGFEPGEYTGIAAVDTDNSAAAPRQMKVYADNSGITLSLDKGMVEIYNTQGALVKQVAHDGGVFTASLPKGFYIISVK